MEIRIIPEKNYHYLIELFDAGATSDIHEILVHSVVVSRDTSNVFERSIELGVGVDPMIYKKYHGNLNHFKSAIRKKYSDITGQQISIVKIFPDLDKFRILNNAIIPVVTPWEEINKSQDHLIGLLKTAKETVDFQNVGNTARTLLQKLSDIVFDPQKHKADDQNIDLSAGKFKNRLHTYIKCEMGGKANEELRDFALSVITTAEKAIDLANKLTHDLNANSLLAESCTISVVTVVSIIKLTKSL